ncbi:MAG: alpha/beta fold hydrolase [Rhodothermales bacterium]
MPTTTVTFNNARGQELAAKFDTPADGRARAYALFAHCFTCTKDLKAVGHLTRAMTRAGYAVLRFDFTGLGQSSGAFEDTDFGTNLEDLEAAAAWLASNHAPPRLLVGHSLGGAAVLHVAERLPDVKAVATIGAPFDPAHVRSLFSNKEADIRKDGAATVSIGGRPFTIRNSFLEDLEARDPGAVVRGLDRALLVMHAPTDGIVGIDNAARIYSAARHPKSFVSLDTADHLLSTEADAVYAGQVLSAWSARYVDKEEPVEDAKHHGHHIMASLDRSHYRTEIVASGHVLVADEPESLGGTNEGPSPYDLVSAGLAACTAITLRMYADRKEWPMEQVQVEVVHEKMHAEDCDCGRDASMGRIDVMDRKIHLHGDLSDEQRQRLLEIANKCPVHRSLDEGKVAVRSRLV